MCCSSAPLVAQARPDFGQCSPELGCENWSDAPMPSVAKGPATAGTSALLQVLCRVRAVLAGPAGRDREGEGVRQGGPRPAQNPRERKRCPFGFAQLTPPPHLVLPSASDTTVYIPDNE